MKYEHVLERARDENQMLENSCLGEPDDIPEQEDDWLDTSKACNLDDPECEACQ